MVDRPSWSGCRRRSLGHPRLSCGPDSVGVPVPLPFAARGECEEFAGLRDRGELAVVVQLRVAGALEKHDLARPRVGPDAADGLEHNVHLLLVEGELGQSVHVVDALARVRDASVTTPRTSLGADGDRQVSIRGEDILEDRIDNLRVDIKSGEAISAIEIFE